MAAWGFEISLSALKIFHLFAVLTCEILLNTSRQNSFVSPSGHVMFYLYFVKTNENIKSFQ